MYLRTISNGRRQYLQIAENYRDAGTEQVCQRYIASLGRLNRLLTDDKGLVDGLLKAGTQAAETDTAPG